MKHETTEFTEKKKRENIVSNRQYVFLWLKIYSVGAVVLFIIWHLFPIVEWKLNYIKWQNAHVEDYELYLSRSELLRYTDYIEPFTYPIYDDEGLLRTTYPADIFKSEYDAVAILFSVAWDKMRNPFTRCSITYDAQYGFPSLISCGQWQRIQVMDFESITNN